MGVDDKRLALIFLLVKLDLLVMRKVSSSWALYMIAGHGNPPPTIPRCAIELANVGLTRDYIEFTLKKNYRKEDEWDLITL